MKKRVLNIIGVLLLTTALLLLFTCNLATYVEEEHYSENYVYIRGSSGVIRFSHILGETTLTTGIAVFLIACNAAMCLISAIKNSAQKDGALHAALPIINLCIFDFFVAPYRLAACEGLFDTATYTTVTHLPVMDTIYLLLFAAIVVGFVKRSRLVVPKVNTEVQKPVNTTLLPQNKAQELKEYKDLLDSGVITQEEFEVKKKQLLNL